MDHDDSRCEHLILLMIGGLVATGVAWFALDPFFHGWQQEVEEGRTARRRPPSPQHHALFGARSWGSSATVKPRGLSDE